MIKINNKHFHKPLALVKLIPNLLTLMSLIIGLNSLKAALDGNWEKSVVCIIIAAIIDGIDGRVARFLHATSPFGAELDSLCDFANFGIFPVFILYLWLLPMVHPGLLWNATVIYAICMVIRLARFNTNLASNANDPVQKIFFTGVPAPIGAVLVLMPLMLSFELISKLNIRSYGFIIPFYVIGISLLLASKIPTFSLKHIHISKEQVWLVMLTFAIFTMEMLLYPWYIIPFMLIMYVMSIPFSIKQAKRLKVSIKEDRKQTIDLALQKHPKKDASDEKIN